jgi:exopolysaccharide biosynthesis WecB/TagA/CpsF family protein
MSIPVDGALRSDSRTTGSKISQPSAGRPRYMTPQINLAGIITDLLEPDQALEMIIGAARGGFDEVLGVGSVNLDHVHHFAGKQHLQTSRRPSECNSSGAQQVRWLNLLDGAPLVRRTRQLTARHWPRLAGSDLIERVLDEAEVNGLSVGFLGGSSETHAALAPVMSKRWPNLRVAGYWAPKRAVLTNPAAAKALTKEIARAEVTILVVCLGKPRQEEWIAEHGYASGATVCLAFGAVVDFLAGRIARAPRWIANHGLEWAWRLLREPRRLARRYLIHGPRAYLALQRSSNAIRKPTVLNNEFEAIGRPFLTNREFRGPEGHADVCAVVVTYNSAKYIGALVQSLRRQLDEQSIRLVVVDNDSADDTLTMLKGHEDVIAVAADKNLGYAGGINLARRYVGEADAILVMNPDLELADHAIRALRHCLDETSAGVVVPRLLNFDGSLYMSLRREPTSLRALGDALFGRRLGGRPAALSEMDMDERSYDHRHAIDWATGAALLIDAGLDRRVGRWDERFFLYSEEIDFLRRVRETGSQIWFEPDAVMRHRQGGSGGSDALEALLAINRVRYHEKWHGVVRTLPFRAAAVLGSALRVWQPRHRTALSYLVKRGKWSELPAATPASLWED